MKNRLILASSALTNLASRCAEISSAGAGLRRSFRWQIGLCASFVLWATTALAGTYYIDYSSGSDSNNGTSMSTPWKRCPGMPSFSGSYSHSNGDRFIFKGGVTWPSPSGGNLITVGNGGSSGSPDYYGVDKTYYTGGTWTRPIIDSGNAASSAFWLVNYNNITIDNFEFVNWGADTVINAYSSTGLLIENCYFHAWVHSGSSDDFNGVNGYAGSQVNGTITNCIFDGAPNGTDSGRAVYHWGGTIVNCIARNMANGFLPNSGTVAGCQIGPINVSFDSSTHENAIEQVGNGLIYIYNNVIHDTVGITIFTGNPGGNAYVWNNLIYNSSPIPIQFDGRGGAFTAYVYNNTVISTLTGGAMRDVGAASVTLVSKNNHLIDGGIAAGFASVTEANDLAQTLSQASSAGYASGNNWKPSSGNAPTVGAGANLTSLGLFTNDLLGNSRPASGAWNIGAYEYSSGGGSTNAVQPPLALTIKGAFQFGAGFKTQ